MQLRALPAPHPISSDGVLGLLLRKYRGSVSCNVPAMDRDRGLLKKIPAAKQSGNPGITYFHCDHRE